MNNAYVVSEGTVTGDSGSSETFTRGCAEVLTV